jgi:hypothetical protein
MNYHISRKTGTEYLQGIEPNEHYRASATAPTMGNRHSYAEYRTIWGRVPVAFERMTSANYIKIIMEEFRWGDTKPFMFCVEPEAEAAQAGEGGQDG